MALTRRFPHHGIPSWDLVQTFYDGTFVETYADESMQFMERLVENWAYQQSFSNNGRNSAPKRGGLINMRSVEPEYRMDCVKRDMGKLGQAM